MTLHAWTVKRCLTSGFLTWKVFLFSVLHPNYSIALDCLRHTTSLSSSANTPGCFRLGGIWSARHKRCECIVRRCKRGVRPVASHRAMDNHSEASSVLHHCSMSLLGAKSESQDWNYLEGGVKYAGRRMGCSPEVDWDKMKSLKVQVFPNPCSVCKYQQTLKKNCLQLAKPSKQVQRSRPW